MSGRAGALLLALLLASAGPIGAQEQAPEGGEAAAHEPGFLGVSMALAPLEGEDPPRFVVRVSAVVPGSPAAAAGIEAGDLLLALDGASLAASEGEVLAALGRAVRERGVGAEVALTVRRAAVEVRTYVDEEPLGPPQDASGRASDEVLPDLGALLGEHPERLVGVRARRFTRERVVRVVLGRRPDASGPPLPDNATLRPDLAARPLGPEAALAERAIARATLPGEGGAVAERWRDLLARFERDEQTHDPFRLDTVRYLRRAPLRLADATRALAVELAAVHELNGLSQLLATARRALDVAAPAAPVASAAPEPPLPGASAEEHGLYLVSLVERAEAAVARALAPLAAEERAFLVETLPSLADKFAEHIYLHEDEDPARWERHARAIELLAEVERGAMLEALETLLVAVDPGYLAQLRDDLRAVDLAGAALAAPGVEGRVLFAKEPRVVIGSSDPNRYRYDAYAVVVDLGGDDVYHVEVGSGRPRRPAALALDLAGHDRYMATAPFAQGCGFLGAGLLVDLEGDDVYATNQPFAQGASLAGAGLLIDRAGDDVYRGTVYAQGAGLGPGLAALIDGGGHDEVNAGLYAQGFAGPGALGLLLARGGDDRYAAVGRAPCSYGDNGVFRGMSQGAAVGFRTRASGGIAALIDEGGRDTYEAGNFSQGGGYYFGWGLLADLGLEGDRYEGARYAQGFAAHSALGSFWDQGGDDVYRSWVGAANSASWDLTATVFLDDAGDDRYAPGPGFSLGASAHNGFALFVDRGGRDSYRLGPGRAGPNDYHGGHSLSVFVDAGGDPDTYHGGGLLDGRGGVDGDAGVVLDLPGPLEAADPTLVERLLPLPVPAAPAAEGGPSSVAPSGE